MKYLSLTCLIITVFVCSCSQPQQGTPKSNIVFDTLQDRPLQIYLPSGHDPLKTYPVIYMHDGQNLFLDSTSYAGEWGVDEILDSLIENEHIPPTIAVGIYNSPQRAEEYIPYNDEYILEMMNMDHWDGSLHLLFADFLTFDLFPYIESTYGAGASKKDRALMGSSLGAVQAYWMGLSFSEYFDMIGVFSPSIWVDQGGMIREAHSYEKVPELKMWIDIGSEEYDARCSELIQELHQRGMTYGEKLWYLEDQGGRHHESSWNQRLAFPILLFKGKSGTGISGMEASIFKGTQSYSSQNDATFFKANLTLTMENGVRYTAMHLANYSSDDLKIDSVGHILSDTSGSLFIDMGDATFDLEFD